MTPEQKIAAMVFGAIIVIASLFLLFLKKEEGQNRVKIFGQEFEISTPSLVVFLAGCGIFILPFFLPSDHAGPVSTSPAPSLAPSSPDRDHPSTVGQQRPNPDRPKEPNDRIEDATPILFGSTITGKLTKYDPTDWYRFTTPDNVSERLLVVFRWIEGNWNQNASLYVYDVNEKELESQFFCCQRGDNITIIVTHNTMYYVKVQGDRIEFLNYELSVRNKSTEAVR